MLYAIRLLNHLGEAHEAHLLRCDDDEHAIDCAREFLHKGYPVEVVQDERPVRLLRPVSSILDDFVRHLLR